MAMVGALQEVEVPYQGKPFGLVTANCMILWRKESEEEVVVERRI